MSYSKLLKTETDYNEALKRIEELFDAESGTAEAVAAVMDELFEIKQNMRKRDNVIKELDDVIKFAVRSTAAFPSTQKYFDVSRCTLLKNLIVTHLFFC